LSIERWWRGHSPLNYASSSALRVITGKKLVKNEELQNVKALKFLFFLDKQIYYLHNCKNGIFFDIDKVVNRFIKTVGKL
jgi:hypothetical protein